MWITSPTAGATVEIRTPPTVEGGLERTELLGAATLAPGTTTIAVNDAAAHPGVLVWISGQAGTEFSYRTELAEIGFLA